MDPRDARASKNQLKSIKFFWALVMTLSIIAVRAL